MTKMAAKWLKSIPNLWLKRLKNHTLWGRTYLYSPYKGVPPPGNERSVASTASSRQRSSATGKNTRPIKVLQDCWGHVHIGVQVQEIKKKNFNKTLLRIKIIVSLIKILSWKPCRTHLRTFCIFAKDLILKAEFRKKIWLIDTSLHTVDVTQ